jgi:hypothetical protein
VATDKTAVLERLSQTEAEAERHIKMQMRQEAEAARGQEADGRVELQPLEQQPPQDRATQEETMQEERQPLTRQAEAVAQVQRVKAHHPPTYLAMVALGLIIQSMERMPTIRVVEAEAHTTQQEVRVLVGVHQQEMEVYVQPQDLMEQQTLEAEAEAEVQTQAHLFQVQAARE